MLYGVAVAVLIAGIAVCFVTSILSWRKSIRDRRDPALLPGDRILSYVFPWVPTLGAVWLLVTLLR